MIVLAKKYSPKVEQELINECINKLYYECEGMIGEELNIKSLYIFENKLQNILQEYKQLDILPLSYEIKVVTNNSDEIHLKTYYKGVEMSSITDLTSLVTLGGDLVKCERI